MRLYLRPALFIALGSFGGLEAQQEGVTPRWEIVAVVQRLDQSANDIRKMLSQVRPEEWVQQGASDAYIGQHNALRSDLSSLALSAQAMQRKPEKLSIAIDTYLWLDRVGSMLRSLTAAVRKYQNPALGELLETAGDRAAASENSLKPYLRQLAVEREAELEISHSEAQRCRETLVRRPRSQK